MAKNMYMLIFHDKKDQPQPQQSPEEMQKIYMAFQAWKEKFKGDILDLGDGLKPTGKVITTAAVTDGPYTEGKEIIGGFTFIYAENYDGALVIAKAMPGQVPGRSLEVREMMGFSKLGK